MKKQHELEWVECERELRANPHLGTLAASSGQGSRKDLLVITSFDVRSGEVSATVRFDVIDHGVRVYSGTDIRAAIDAYNAAP